jgi:hypothetical protein
LSQVTITASDFPDGDDTVMVSVSSDFELDYESTGEDYIWNFSSLTYENQRIDTFFDINDASLTYQVIFNNGFFDADYQADYYTNFLNFAIPSLDLIGLTIDKPVGFSKIESDAVEIVGVGLEISGVQVPIKSEIIDIEYELPMTFGDNWVSNSFLEIDLNPAYDGIFRRHQNRTSFVDGWGVVNTPFGTFNAVRVTAQLDFSDSLQITFGEISTWVEVPTPSQKVYSWFTNDQKIPILQVVSQNVFGVETVTSVEYRDKYRGVANIQDQEEQSQLSLFPNPASQTLNIEGLTETVNYNIYDIEGRIVQFGVLTPLKPIVITNQLDKGMYLIHFISQENKVLRFEIQ